MYRLEIRFIHYWLLEVSLGCQKTVVIFLAMFYNVSVCGYPGPCVMNRHICGTDPNP